MVNFSGPVASVAIGSIALLFTAGCSSPQTSATTSDFVAAAQATSDQASPSMPVPVPPQVPCQTPKSAEDINALPGYPELVVQAHLTGKRLASDLGQGSDIEVSSAKPLIGELPNGLRIYTNASVETPALPEGDYVLLLGSYNTAMGTYFIVGGNQGTYAVKADGSLHQQCVLWPGQTGPTETSDGIQTPQLLSIVTASMAANADKLAEIAKGVPPAVVTTEGVAKG